jgi:hypothetical protein
MRPTQCAGSHPQKTGSLLRRSKTHRASYGIGYRSYTEPYYDSCGDFRDAVIAIIATVA